MIKTWQFEFWSVRNGLNSDYEDEGVVQETFDKNIDHLVDLEDAGFDGVFFSEHHFVNTLSPCPNLLVAAVAQRTKRLRLGVLGNVFAMHQPHRLAEELAMLDYLTHGRLEIGSAVGIPPEFAFLGIAPQDVRAMHAEAARFIELAKQNKHVTFHGDHFNYEDVLSMPRPRKVSYRREWATAQTESSVVSIAKRNAKLALGFQSTEGLARLCETYREAMAAENHPATPDDILIRRQVMIWDTDAEAAALHSECSEVAAKILHKMYEEPVAKVLERIGGQLPTKEGIASGVKDAQFIPSAGSSPKPAPSLAERISPEEYIFGSPKTVAEIIIEQCRKTGAANIAVYESVALNREQLSHHTELWKKVIPILKSADVLPDFIPSKGLAASA
ncbi:LLM class flavin-dependent oxidoreductase [Bradyrhizobium sp. STM 3561]|uniref:LLM class flavin-dependent oxidoreductase n=1 Tax=unclassified Bradyrhizobium TaxID=2631580 RepID=UPI003890DD37